MAGTKNSHNKYGNTHLNGSLMIRGFYSCSSAVFGVALEPFYVIMAAQN